MDRERIEERPYKSFDTPEEPDTIAATLYDTAGVTKEDIRRYEKYRDPVLLAALLSRTLEEKKRQNELLKEIAEKLDKLDELEKRLERLEQYFTQQQKKPSVELLGDVDEKIMDFLKRVGQATAEEVQKALHYKGRNGASARLHKLFLAGLLEKKHAGRKVYYAYKAVEPDEWQGDIRQNR